MADDIGYWNISAYNRGMMGYRAPNIVNVHGSKRSRLSLAIECPLTNQDERYRG
jgi:hypothetical protein